MKVEGDKTCIVTCGDGVPHEFSYRTDTYIAEYEIRRDWVRDNIGLFGKDYYYNRGTWWFKSEEDLLAFVLRFDNDRRN